MSEAEQHAKALKAIANLRKAIERDCKAQAALRDLERREKVAVMGCMGSC